MLAEKSRQSAVSSREEIIEKLIEISTAFKEKESTGESNEEIFARLAAIATAVQDQGNVELLNSFMALAIANLEAMEAYEGRKPEILSDDEIMKRLGAITAVRKQESKEKIRRRLAAVATAVKEGRSFGIIQVYSAFVIENMEAFWHMWMKAEQSEKAEQGQNRSLQNLQGEDLGLSRKEPQSEKQPHQPSHVERVQGKTRRLTPKKQHQKSMEVFLDSDIRNGIKALAVIHNMPAQDYAERVLVRDVEQNDNLVREGMRILEETHGNLTNARLKYLEEKVGQYTGITRR